MKQQLRASEIHDTIVKIDLFIYKILLLLSHHTLELNSEYENIYTQQKSLTNMRQSIGGMGSASYFCSIDSYQLVVASSCRLYCFRVSYFFRKSTILVLFFSVSCAASVLLCWASASACSSTPHFSCNSRNQLTHDACLLFLRSLVSWYIS